MAEYKVNIQDTIESSFLTYAGHVIQDRSIPDVRDGLKLGARQLLYSQYAKGITHDKGFKKGIKSVSAAMELCYVHGDSSAYGTLIRMAKPFALRYPLEETQGNFGTPVESDNHGASRYVELRASALADELFEGLKKNAITKWKSNYDDTELIPSVLPSASFYNIVNGSSGIAVGMSTSIPQFNLREVNNALVKLVHNPDATFEQLYCPIDFATGGIIVNEDEVKTSLKIGNGKSAKVRAKIDYDPKKHQLIVTEMPYMVYTNPICKQLGALINDDPNTGIIDFIDATTDVPCIEIMLSKKANPEQVKNWLYANTSLQSHYSINMIMLDNGKSPKLFGWKEALSAHLAHSKQVTRNILTFDLNKAKDRLHIVEGLLIAIAHIDEFIKLIRGSNSAAEASVAMCQQYGLDEIQAKAILAITLARLVKLEYVKVQKEKEELLKTIADLENLLANEQLFNNYLITSIESVSQKFGDKRRTTNLNLVINDNEEILPAEEKKLVVSISNNGVILATDVDTFNKQARGGKGAAIKLKNNDFIIETIYGANSDNFMMLSNLGKSYTLNLGTLPLGEEIYLQSLLELSLNERITKIVSYDRLSDYAFVTIVTKNGLIKKTAIEEYKSKRKGGLIGIKLREGDEVSAVLISKEDDEVIIATSAGKNVRYPLSDINVTGRATQGVKAIELPATETIVGAVDFNPKDFKGLITISAKGMAKVSDLEEYTYSSRNSKGTNVLKLKDDTLAGIGLQQDDSADIIVATSTNIIRFSVAELRNSGKNTIGTTTIKLASNAKILYIGQVV